METAELRALLSASMPNADHMVNGEWVSRASTDAALESLADFEVEAPRQGRHSYNAIRAIPNNPPRVRSIRYPTTPLLLVPLKSWLETCGAKVRE